MILREFVCLLRRYVCTATGQGGEPTPGEYPTKFCMYLSAAEEHATTDRQFKRPKG